MTTYFASRGRRAVPLLQFVQAEGESFYSQLKQDLEALQYDSDDISNYQGVQTRET